MDIINRIRLEIGGAHYTISTAEPEDYVQELAGQINKAINETMSRNPSLSLNDALVLCLLDCADARRKSEKNADHIREQLAGYLADASKARAAADTLQGEVARLKRELAQLRQAAKAGPAAKEGQPKAAAGEGKH